MNRKRHFLSPLFRSFAAATLMIWVGAFALCTAHCSLGVTLSSTKSPCCKDESKKQSNENKPVSNLACLAFKAAVTPDYSPAVFGMEASHLYQLPLLLALFDSAFQPTPLTFRQAWRFDSPLTPVVYLGTANQSHAPPVLA